MLNKKQIKFLKVDRENGYTNLYFLAPNYIYYKWSRIKPDSLFPISKTGIRLYFEDTRPDFIKVMITDIYDNRSHGWLPVSISRQDEELLMEIAKMKKYGPFEIEKVIFNEPATIVLWADGSKTVVKANGEVFDPEKGLAMAFTKKALGNTGNYYNNIKKWTESYTEINDLSLSRSVLDYIRQYTQNNSGHQGK